MFVVTLLPDVSNNYFVDSQKSYKIALNNMVCPKGFEEYESMYICRATWVNNSIGESGSWNAHLLHNDWFVHLFIFNS